MTDLTPEKALEAILFYKAAPVQKTELVSLLNLTPEELTAAVSTLTKRLTTGATRLLETDTELSLVTAPTFDTLIEQLRRDELKRDIGKAGAETLAIVLYRGPVTRGEIDRIRGVNSAYIVRNLMVRGLIERSPNQKRQEFQITSELLSHLGMTHKSQLPEYEAVLAQLDSFNAQAAAETET